MPAPDVFVVGASAGGVRAVGAVLRRIPAGFPATLLVVIHVGADSPRLLDSVLQRDSRLPVVWGEDGMSLEGGRVIVAPVDLHLGVDDHRARVWQGPRENRHRPAIDVTMRSVAEAHGQRCAGVVLSGYLDDGTAGLIEIKRAGGTTIVQDPAEADFPDMPRNALRNAPIDYVLPLSGIGELIDALANGRIPPAAAPTLRSPGADEELEVSHMHRAAERNEDREGEPSLYTCPDCGGSLWEMKDGGLLRFRCRVGHAFTQATMASAQSDGVERALWAALRTMEEKLSLSRRLADDARRRGLLALVGIYERKIAETEQHAAVVRDLLRDTAREPVTAG